MTKPTDGASGKEKTPTEGSKGELEQPAPEQVEKLSEAGEVEAETPQKFDSSLLNNDGGGDQKPPESTVGSVAEAERLKHVNHWYNEVVEGKTEISDEKMPGWVREILTGHFDSIKDTFAKSLTKEEKKPQDDVVTKLDLLLEKIPPMPKSGQLKMAQEAQRLQSLGMTKFNAWQEVVTKVNDKLSDAQREELAISMSSSSGSMGGDYNQPKKLTDSAKKLSKRLGLTDKDIERFVKKKS